MSHNVDVECLSRRRATPLRGTRSRRARTRGSPYEVRPAAVSCHNGPSCVEASPAGRASGRECPPRQRMAVVWTGRDHPTRHQGRYAIRRRRHLVVEFTCTGPRFSSDVGWNAPHRDGAALGQHRCAHQHLRKQQLHGGDRVLHTAWVGMADRRWPTWKRVAFQAALAVRAPRSMPTNASARCASGSERRTFSPA